MATWRAWCNNSPVPNAFESLRRAVSVMLFPVLLSLTVAATLALLPRLGLPPTAALLWTGSLVILVVVEAVFPDRSEWRAPDGQLFHDFGHAALGSGLGGQLGAYATELLLIALAAQALPPFQAALGSVQAWATAAAIYLVIDYTRYWQHRLTHAVSGLWAVHVLHHDANRLVAIKAGRSHVFDRALQSLCIVPPVLLGAPLDMVGACVILNSTIGLIAHANIDVKLGALGLIWVGPAEHRMHHASEHNFGASLLLWDHLHGTYARARNVDVGLDVQTPTRFLAQLAAPIASWRARTLIER